MTNAEKRSARLRAARSIATHTALEWELLKLFHEYACVICKKTIHPVEKDHIISVRFDGSSDGIANLQPVCAYCNISKKNSADFRKPGWQEFICLVKNLPAQEKAKGNQWR